MTHLMIILAYFLLLSRLLVSVELELLHRTINSISFSASIKQNGISQADLASSGKGSEGFSSAIPNSGCFSYLNRRDGCAYRNPVNNCAWKITSMKVLMFEMSAASASPDLPLPLSRDSEGHNITANTTQSSAPNENRSSERKRKRNNSLVQQPANIRRSVLKRGSLLSKNSPSDTSNLRANIVSSSSDVIESNICGDFSGESQLGICLWSGPDPDPDASNGTTRGWISSENTRNCNKEVVLQRVGSTSPPIFAQILEGCSFNTIDPSAGCSQIYLTKKTFMALQPNPREVESGFLDDAVIWDFNSQQNIFNAAE